MSERLEHLVRELESYLPCLVERRTTDPLANDCYEAADDWRHLGQRLLQSDTRVNYRERARGERILLEQLREVLSTKGSDARQEYGRLIQAGAELIEIAAAIPPLPDGHLGFLRIARAYFEFLCTDFGFYIVHEEPTSIRFSSGDVYLELAHSVYPSLSCAFGPEPPKSGTFWIDTLLFMRMDQGYKSLPERLQLNSEKETESWVEFLANVLKKHGTPVFSNQAGIFDELVEAQVARDAEIEQQHH